MSMIHLVDIEQKTNTQDSVTGEITESWSSLYEDIFCDISPLSVKEFISAAAFSPRYPLGLRYRI